MALTTVEDVKAHRLAQGNVMNTTPEKDDRIEALINAVSARFETYCDRTFLSSNYTEYHDGDGHGVIYTKQYPLTSVSGIWDDMDWNWEDNTLVDSTSYRIVDDNCVVFKSGSFLPGIYRQNIKISYTAGYETVPYDLVIACIDEVLRVLDTRYAPGVSYATNNDETVSFVTTDFLDTTKVVLNKYKRRGAL